MSLVVCANCTADVRMTANTCPRCHNELRWRYVADEIIETTAVHIKDACEEERDDGE